MIMPKTNCENPNNNNKLPKIPYLRQIKSTPILI